MIIYDFTQKSDSAMLPDPPLPSRDIFILCHTSEVEALQSVFGFDESTVLECTDLDESVRFSSFDGYDFISLVRMTLARHRIELSEINLYVSAHSLVLVVPDMPEEVPGSFRERVLRAIREVRAPKAWINAAVYAVFHLILSDLSDMLETLESEVTELQDQIIRRVDRPQFEAITRYRHMAYTVKKHLRAASYLGAQMLVDPNELIHRDYRRYYLNIDTRLKKLYDFAESINELCDHLLVSYDSRLTLRTNEIVNKLTVLTVLFGPLTVITGIYGMNFDFMPELRHPLGYPAALVLMAAVTGGILWLLRRNRWI